MTDKVKSHGSPGVTEDADEQRMIGLARALAEKQLKEGTASAQVIAFYIKLGSSREELEKENLKKQNDLLQAKVKALGDMKEFNKIYTEAIAAMKTYTGASDGQTTTND